MMTYTKRLLLVGALLSFSFLLTGITFYPVALVEPDFFTEVALGNVPGHTSISKFGRNPITHLIATDTAVNIGRDIWDGGVSGATMWVPPTAACKHAIVGDATDALDDVGAWTIQIYGLNATYALDGEVLSMHATDGSIAVNTVNDYTMIHRIKVLTAGSGGVNVGNITATAASGGTVTAQITALNNQTAMAIFQCPAVTTCLLYGYDGSIHKVGQTGKLADVSLMLKDFGGVWRHQDAFDVSSDGQPHNHHEYPQPLSLPAKSYVKIVANPSVDSQDISAGFDIIMVAD